MANEPVDMVIDHLNAATNPLGRFRHSEASRRNIRARIAEGATLDDCFLVIDYKAAEWCGDIKMEAYLRPRTLFIPAHFEEYLSAAIRWVEKGRPKIGKAKRNVEDDLAAIATWANGES